MKGPESILNNEIQLYTISNNWMEVTVCSLGCTITSIILPGKDSVKRNIVLNYGEPAGYLEDSFYVGSTVGRVAGRINQGSFTIDGQFYQLSQNDGSTENHLHGGINGFNKKKFLLVSSTKTSEEASLLFCYHSKDGEEGYPGNLKLWVSISLTDDNKIKIQYRAVTDKKTYVNPTNHSYFNFTGLRQSATDHELYVNADYYIETDKQFIPTGAILPVAGTWYDFREMRKINKFYANLDTGYNECFVLNKDKQVKAILFEPHSGICMAVTTSFPGLLVYTGDFLTDPFVKNQGICLETQFYPDSPNQAHFPSTLLNPGQEFIHHTQLAFPSLVNGK